ncbi:hypothetical protein Ac2012v2_002269 [Leucoagaricus gongylophorus]
MGFAKSKAPSIKSTFGSAWGSSTFGSLGFGDAARDSQLSPEELKLIDISGEPAKNSSSLFDDWDHVAATPSNLANDPLDTPATERAGDANTTHDPPPVLNDQAPSEDQHRVPSPSLATVPTESAKIPTAESTETSTETPLNADADPHGDPIAAKESTAPGTPAVGGTITPDTPAARDATGPDAEEPPTATAEDDWNIPVKVKKGKKKTGGNSGVATPNPDGNEASGAVWLETTLDFVDNLPNIGDTTQGFSPAPINETSPSDEDAESASGQEMEGLDPSNSDRILKQKLKAEHFGV